MPRARMQMSWSAHDEDSEAVDYDDAVAIGRRARST